MDLHRHFVLLGDYNRWMNHKLYEAAAGLSAEALALDRGAFFGSILGTLNHLVVADTIWLRRFATCPDQAQALQDTFCWPEPKLLNEILFNDVDALREHRERIDQLLVRWVSGLNEMELAQAVDYKNMRGEVQRRVLSALLLHLFNHQTHHRGQVSVLLSQAGIDIGVTDLLVRIPMSPT